MSRDINKVLHSEGREAALQVEAGAERFDPANVIDLHAGRKAEQTDNRPLIKSSAEFIADFVPPEYVVDGLLQRRFIYSLVGMTGAGKTAIALRLAASTALGAIFANRQTERCRVLYAAAENPDDVRMRWIALSQHMGFDAKAIDVYFTDRRFKISEMKEVLRAEAEKLGGEFGLVIIDTSAAFFEGDDESSRAQQGAHASMLRSLIDTIPGQPCVLVPCHPVKNPDLDNLLPAGGGNFVNEMDGNLTVTKTDLTSEVHWNGKFRGPDFAPFCFLIKTVTRQDLKDKKGKLIPTVISEALSDQAKDDIADNRYRDENEVLAMLKADPKISLSAIATRMGWKLYSGEPHKNRADRCIKTLIKDKFVKKARSSRYTLTEAGENALKEAN